MLLRLRLSLEGPKLCIPYSIERQIPKEMLPKFERSFDELLYIFCLVVKVLVTVVKSESVTQPPLCTLLHPTVPSLQSSGGEGAKGVQAAAKESTRGGGMTSTGSSTTSSATSSIL